MDNDYRKFVQRMGSFDETIDGILEELEGEEADNQVDPDTKESADQISGRSRRIEAVHPKNKH